jgi:site-specific DNA-methyltransferase (adenine-specific)
VDFFAGSGTAGVAAANLGRRFLLVDSSDEAVKVMRKRLASTRQAAQDKRSL